MPIDKNFRTTWRITDHHNTHPVWRLAGDDSTEIHGDMVGVDMSLCFGCQKCILACPTNVFSTWTDTKGRFVADPINDSDCILCLICEIVCPVEAICVKRESGSEDTLTSLLQGNH